MAKRKMKRFEKLQAREWRTLSRDIAPSNMSIKPQYIVFDKTIAKYILIGVTRNGERGLPKNLNPELLNSLMSVDGGNYTIGLTTAIMRVPNAEAARALHDAEMMQIGNQHVERESNKTDYVSSDTRSDLSDTNEDAKKIHQQKEVMTWTAFVLTILAEDKEAIQEAEGHITQVLGAKLVRNEIPTGKLEVIMKTVMPTPAMPEWAHGNPLTDHASVLLAAQNVNTASDAVGLRLGHLIGNPSQQVTVDLSRLPAEHVLAIGGTGSGKTTAGLMWLYRLYTELKYNVVFVTAKADEGTDHRNLARAAGKDGVIIDIGPGMNSINPLQIVYTERNVENTNFAWTEVVHNHIDLVTRFFSVFLEETMSAPMRSYINETLIRLYENHGIYVDHPETLKEALRNAKYPHLSDLIDIWIQDRDEGGKGDRGKTINSLISNTYQLTMKGALSYLNRDSDIIDIDKKVIVIDVSGIRNERMRSAMNVLTTGIMWQKFRTTKNSKQKTAIAIDEARVFLSDPITRRAIVDQLTLARSDHVMCIYMTQQLSDISKNEIADEVKNNIFVNVVFGPGKDDSKASLVKEYYNFTDEEVRKWVKLGVGQAMIAVQGTKTPVEIKLTDFELGMIKGTNFAAKSESENQSTATGSCIDKRVQELVMANGICLSAWCEGEDQERYFAELKWQSATFNSATGAGMVKAWVKPGLIVNEMVGAQSEDHYATVLQIAAHLLLNGADTVEVHHTTDVDVSAKIGAEWFAFEFEKPGSHTKDQLMDKQKRAGDRHDVCYFIGVTENINFLKKSVIAQNVIPRGAQLRRLMGNLIEERK